MKRLALMLALCAAPAAAQVPCAPYRAFIAMAQDTGLVLQSRASRWEIIEADGDWQSNRVVIEVWANRGGWQMVETDVRGRACLIAHGDFYWQPARL